MAFTRFSYDVDRTKKQLQQSTDPGRFIMNVPGPGESVTFMDDPHFRLTKWGGNLRTNTVNLESDLRGLTRNLNRDHIDKNNYEKRSVVSSAIHHKVCDKSYTDQSRASHPAWQYRDLEQVNWYILPKDPQEHVCMTFQNNLTTRTLEKDYYERKQPCINQNPLELLKPKKNTMQN